MSPIAYERMCRPCMRDAATCPAPVAAVVGRAEFVDRPGSGFPFAVGPRRAFGFRFAARGVTRFRLPQLTVTHMKHITRPNSVLQPINMSNYLRDRENASHLMRRRSGGHNHVDDRTGTRLLAVYGFGYTCGVAASPHVFQ